jgi:hypothetical protein
MSAKVEPQVQRHHIPRHHRVLATPIVLTENLVSDRVGIGESKAELERPVQRDYFAKILDAFASVSSVLSV